MKTAKLVIGIVSVILFVVVTFQSCAAGYAAETQNNLFVIGKYGGFLLAFFLLAGGVVGMLTRDRRGGGITAGVLYGVGALVGLSNLGIFPELVIWISLSAIFAAVFILGSVGMKKSRKSRG